MHALPAQAEAPRHYLPLDGLRGAAILLVVWHNAGWIAQIGEGVSLKLVASFTAAGWVGVQIFFVLSGFLITGILLDTKGRPDYLRGFFIRRTLRIFPLYYAFLAAVILVGPLVAWDASWAESARRLQWPYWFYVSNWFEPVRPGLDGMAHIWSLAVEEQFYVVWPFVVAALSRGALLKLSLALIAAGPFIRLGLRALDLPADAAYLLTIARFDAIACGALLALVQRDAAARALLVRVARPLAAAVVLALLALVLMQRGFHSREVPVQVIGQTLIALAAAGAIAFAIEGLAGPIPAWQRLWSFAPLRFFGKYSYAMYVFHLPIHRLLTPLMESWVQGEGESFRVVRLAAYLSIVTALSVAGALVSWRLLEKPCLDLRDRWAPRAA